MFTYKSGCSPVETLYSGTTISRFCSVHFKRLGWRISFVIPRTSLYRGSLDQGSTVLTCFLICLVLKTAKPLLRNSLSLTTFAGDLETAASEQVSFTIFTV